MFPKGIKGIKRTTFGRSGKGRFAPFCFADSYEVATTKDGESVTVRVALASKGTAPFEITLDSVKQKSGHGTTVTAVVEKNLLAVEELCQLIGSKFIVDPSLCILVNEQPVELMSLEGLKNWHWKGARGAWFRGEVN